VNTVNSTHNLNSSLRILALSMVLVVSSSSAQSTTNSTTNNNPFKGLFDLSQDICKWNGTASSVANGGIGGVVGNAITNLIPKGLKDLTSNIKEFCAMVPFLDSASQKLLNGQWSDIFESTMNTWLSPYINVGLGDLSKDLGAAIQKGIEPVAKVVEEANKKAHDTFLNWNRFTDEAMIAIGASPGLKRTLEANAEEAGHAAEVATQAVYNASLSKDAANGSVATSNQLATAALEVAKPGGTASELDGKAKTALSTREETELIVNSVTSLMRQEAMGTAGMAQQLGQLAVQNSLTTGQLTALVSDLQRKRMEEANTVAFKLEQQVSIMRDQVSEARANAIALRDTFKIMFGTGGGIGTGGTPVGSGS
jgi:hypothetical protein